MTDFFNHPIRQKLLPVLFHMEHGIKITKNKIITHKYNFGVSARNLDMTTMRECLSSVGYADDVIAEITHYIETADYPYSGFGVEDNHIEFYVESNKVIRSWNLSTNKRYIYQEIQPMTASQLLERNISKELFIKFKVLLDDIFFIYVKTPYKSRHEDVFNLYFKNRNPKRVDIVKESLLVLLKTINTNSKIDNYLKMYGHWYLHWLHISKKQDGSLQITPYFRNKEA